MLKVRYTAWDGTQRVRLDADRVFEKLAEALSYTDDVQQALDWLLRQGLDLDGVRVMGLDDLLSEVREQMRERLGKYNLDEAFDEPRSRLDDILEREREALEAMRREGDEGAVAREKQAFLDDLPDSLSDAIQRLAQQYGFVDPEAERRFKELLGELDDIRALEQFGKSNPRAAARPDVARLPAGARADARDGGAEGARAQPLDRQLPGARSGDPAPPARRARGAGSRAPGPDHRDAHQRRLPDPEGGPRQAVGARHPQDRPARAARHLPADAARPAGQPHDRPARRGAAPARAHAPVPRRRHAGACPRADADERGAAQAVGPARGVAARLRGARGRPRHDHVDGAAARHELVDELGGGASPPRRRSRWRSRA